MKYNDKLKTLQKILKEMDHVAVAFSGGVDSTFLLKVAHDTLGEKAMGVLAVSPTFPSREYSHAKELAKIIGAKIKIINTHELEDDNFVNNPENRCYFCKSELFERIAELAGQKGFENMVDGTNYDDLGDHRPGMKALREKGVRSPLQEAQLTKDEIRILSKEYDLPSWKKEELACLSSRFPYGEKIDVKKLKMVDEAENFLKDEGFRNIRARHQKTTIKIEVEPEDIARFFEQKTREKIITKLKAIGYTYVTVDLEGYRRGSLNENLNSIKESIDLKEAKIIS